MDEATVEALIERVKMCENELIWVSAWCQGWYKKKSLSMWRVKGSPAPCITVQVLQYVKDVDYSLFVFFTSGKYQPSSYNTKINKSAIYLPLLYLWL